MKTLAAITIALLLASCSATYDSPRTGIRYRLEVPFSAVSPYLPALNDK